MVAIVGGNALGVSLGSLATLGQQGATGSSATGRNGEQVYVNALTGNLVLQDRDELLVGRGLGAESLRTYNSRGLMTDDNGDNWSLGVYAQQLQLEVEGTYAQPGSVFIRTDRDGAQARYTWDPVGYRYVTTDGAGAHDIITHGEDDRWVWTDGSTGREERYNMVSWRLEQATEPNGSILRYGYNGARLTSVAVNDREFTYYDYDGDLLQQIRTVTDEQGSPRTTTRVRYGYDEQRRLASVTVDLTPENTTDQATYITGYEYEADSKRIARVTQTDGTSLSFTYDGTGRIKTVTDGLNQTTTINYESAAGTEVVGPMGLRTFYDHDPSGRLLMVASGADYKRFYYNTAGDLIRTVDGTYTVDFEYDNRGNQTLQRDGKGGVIERTFDAHNQLLTETVYAVPDPDGTGPAKAGAPMVTRYVYDAAGKNRLRFVLTPQGRVTEYIYDALGQRTSILKYTGASYTVDSLAATAVPTEEQLESWAFAQRTTKQLVRTDMAYDARGQLSSSTVFNTVSAVGNGVPDGEQSVTQYVYDQQGLLRQTIAPGARTTAYAYDGLGRLIADTDAAGVTTLTIYDDANNQTRVKYDNGLATISTYDRAGRLAAVQQFSNTGLSLGTTTYLHDDAGRLRMIEDPTGRRQWMLYDAAGRKTADIDADGSLTEYLYDSSGRLGKTIAYTNRVAVAALANLTLTIDKLRPAKVPATDLVSWTTYDAAGRLDKVIDGSGAVTQTFYDGASRVTAVTRYATRVNTALPAFASNALLSPVPAVSPSPTRDRTVRYVYDKDGLLKSEADAEGHLTEYEYDAAGRRTVTLRHGDTPAQDIRSVTLYNGQGRVAAEIDGENYLTEFAYDSNGNLARQVRYHPALAGRVEPGTPLASIRPAPTAGEQQVTAWDHDELNRVRSMTDPEGTVTTYLYDRMGRLQTTTRAVGTDEVRAINARYDLQGRLIGELSAEGGALLTGHLTTSQIEDIWHRYGLVHEYDEAGRLKSTTDRRLEPENGGQGEGLKTLYFYTADGRLERTVNPLGEVEHRYYNGLNQLERIEHYGPGTTDRSRTSFKYDNQGLLDSRTVALDATTNATTSFDYDAFGGEVLRITDLGQGARRIDRTDYDRRGLQTTVTMDDGGLAIKTTSHYDAFGRRDLFIDGNGQSHRQVFDRLGRVVTTIDGLGKARSTSYDAFDRVFTQTDALLHTTTYAYDTAQRSVTVITPEGVRVTTRHTRHGQTLSITDGEQHTTRFEYDHDGHLLHTTTPLTTSHQEFDRAGRLTKTIDANGVEVTYDYDAANRLLHRRVDPAGLNLETSYEYDGLGRQFKVTDPNKVVTLTGFDLAGRVLTQTVDPGGLNLQTVYTHDALDNVLTVQGPGGRFTRYVYDALGRRTEEHVLAEVGQPMLLTKYHYDNNGNVVGRTDANGYRTQLAYDANDRLLFSVDATGGTTRNEYDDEGRLVRTTRYAQPISLVGLPVPATAADILPRALAVSSLGQDSIDARRYDQDGRLRFQVDGTGAVVEFKYDNNGNVTERIAYAHGLTQDWDGSTDPAVVRDPARDLHTRTVYDALNRARFTADALGTVAERRYDNNGNLLESILHAKQITAEQRPDEVANDPADRTEVFEYDKANRQTWHADAAGSVTRFDYDDNGNLERQSRFAQPLTGQEKPSSLGEPGAADRTTRYTYDHAGRRRFAVDALNFVDAWDYAPDGTLRSHTRFNAQLEESQEPKDVLRNSALDRTEYFEYDAAGRLLMHTDAAAQREHFTYDGLGNKRSFTDKNGNTWNYEYDAAGRLSRQYSPAVEVTSTTGGDGNALGYTTALSAPIVTYLQYDGRGLLVARTEAEGRPGQQRTTRFEYDAAGRQVAITYPRVGVYDITKDTPATGPEVARLEDQVELRSRTVYDALGNAVATVDAAGNVSFKVYDTAGRVIGEIDALGQATQHLRNAFGEVETTIRYAVATSLAGGKPEQADQAGTILANHAGNGVDHSKDRVLRMRYDAVGRVIEVKEPRVYNYDAKAAVGTTPGSGIPGTTSDASKITTSQYDAFGDLRITREAGEAGRTPPVQTFHYYDALGRRTATIDTMGYVTERGYDAAGNLSSSTEFSTALTTGQWDWDGYQAATEDVQHDRRTSWTYDGMNRKRTETRHDLVYSDDASGLNRTADAVTEYRYDANGNLTQTIDALGATTTTFYDALGRVKAIAAPQRLISVGPIDTMATPLTLFLRDALGHAVVQIESARGGASPTDYVATSDDRTTVSRFDALDHEVQRTDAEHINHFMSYNALGLLGKSWQLVRDPANNDQPALTLYKGFAYDRLGRVAHAYDPPPFTEDQRAGSGVIDTVHEYNAFGELTKKYTYGTPEAEREYFDYDNAGRLWRTNTGDGVDKIYLHDVLGRQTASIVSKGTRDLRLLTQTNAIDVPDVRVTRTEYDALGRAVVQTLPQREVSQEGVTLRREFTTQAILHSEQQKEYTEGDSNVQLRWEGENEVHINWTSLEGFGSGNIKVQLDYMSAPSTIYQGGIPATVDPVPMSLTRIFPSDQTTAGAILKWTNGAGISEVKGLKVWKQDAKGEWRQLSDQTTFGAATNAITVDLPEDPEAKTHVLIRDNDTQPWRDVTTDAYNFGSRLWFNGSGLTPGSFQYEVRTTFPDGTEKTVAVGTLTLASSPRLAALPALTPTSDQYESRLIWYFPGDPVFKYRHVNSNENWSSLPVVTDNYPYYGIPLGYPRESFVSISQLPFGEYEYELLMMDRGGIPVAHTTGTFSTTTAPHINHTGVQLINIEFDGANQISWRYPKSYLETLGATYTRYEFEIDGLPMERRTAWGNSSIAQANFIIPDNLAPGRHEFRISPYFRDSGGGANVLILTESVGVITKPLSGPLTVTFAQEKILDVRLEADGRVSWPTHPDSSLAPIFEVNGDNSRYWTPREVTHSNGRSFADFKGIGQSSAGLTTKAGPQFRIRYVNSDGVTVALGSGGMSKTPIGYSTKSTTADHPYAISLTSGLQALATPTFYASTPSELAWEGGGSVFNYRRLNSTDGWASLPVSPTGNSRHGVDTRSLPSGEYEYELLDTSNRPTAHATGTFKVTVHAGAHVGLADLPILTDVRLEGTEIVWKYPDVEATEAEFELEGSPTLGLVVRSDGTSRATIPSNLARPGQYQFRITYLISEAETLHQVAVTLGTGVITMPLSGAPTLSFTRPEKVSDVRLESDGRVSWPTPSDSSLTPVFETNIQSELEWRPASVTKSGGRSYADFLGNLPSYQYDTIGPQFRIRYVRTDGVTVALGSGGLGKRNASYSSTSTTADHPDAISVRGDTSQYTLYQDFTLNGYKGLQTPHIDQTFDRWGNVLSTTDPRNANWKTEFAYNQNNQLVYQRRPNSDGGDTGGPVTQIYYDKLGRQLAVRDANNHINGAAYDAAGQVTSEIHADGGHVTHGYDLFGRRVKTTDAQGNADADNLFNLAQASLAQGNLQQYGTFWAMSFAVRDAHTQRFTYDKLDRLTKLSHGNAYVYRTNADTHGTQVLNDGQSVAITETFTYDEAGRQLSHVNGNGELTQYRYDLGGHIVRTEQRGTLHATEGLVTRYAYDERGHKTLEIDANGDHPMRWSVDAFGRAREHVDLGGATVRYTYDKAGQLKVQTSTRGQTQKYSYDSAGQLVGLEQKVDANTLKTTSYTYDLAGNRVHERTVQEGVVAQDNYIGYDALGRMRYVFDGQASLELDYDLNGNRTLVKSSVRVPTEADDHGTDKLVTSARYFAYDEMNRQKLVDGSSATTRGPNGHTITYDLNGNRLTDTYVSNRVKVNEIRELQLDEYGREYYTLPTYTYDVQKGVDITETYQYDTLNRLQSVIRDNVQVDYREYDGAGRVVRSGTPGGNSQSDTDGGLPPGYVAKINEDKEVKDAIGLDKRINRYDAYGRLAYQNIFDGNAYNNIKQGVEYVAYDQVGNVKQYRLHIVSDEGPNVVKTYKTELVGYEGYVQSTLAVSGGHENGLTTSSYDLDGNLRKIEDRVTPALNRSFITDAQGRVLFVRQGEHVQRELIVNGESLGNFGVGPDQADPRQPDNTPNFAPRADFSFGYQPISGNYPGPAPGVYTVRQGDSLQGIARQAYGDSKLWYRIAEANGLSGDNDLRVGQTLAIPAGVGTIHNDFETFQPYDPSRIVGDTTPSLPYFRNECGALSNIIGVVVTVVVSYFGGGAYAAMAGDAARQVSAAMLNGRFDWKDFAKRTAIGGALDIAVGPGTGGYYMGRDKEHPPGFTEVEYDYKSTAIAGAAGWAGSAAGAAAGAAGSAAGAAASAAVTAQVTQQIVSNLVSQGLNMAMGRQQEFNWKSLVSAATGIPTSAQDILGMVASNVTGYALNGGFSGASANGSDGTTVYNDGDIARSELRWGSERPHSFPDYSGRGSGTDFGGYVPPSYGPDMQVADASNVLRLHRPSELTNDDLRNYLDYLERESHRQASSASNAQRDAWVGTQNAASNRVSRASASVPIRETVTPLFEPITIEVPRAVSEVAGGVRDLATNSIAGLADITVAPLADVVQVSMKALHGVVTGDVRPVTPFSSYGERVFYGDAGVADGLKTTALNVFHASPAGMVYGAGRGGYDLTTAAMNGNVRAATTAAGGLGLTFAGAYATGLNRVGIEAVDLPRSGLRHTQGGAIGMRFVEVPSTAKPGGALGNTDAAAKIGVPATRSANPLSPVLEFDAYGNEIYYRAMKESHFRTLAEDGVLTGTGETSLAPLGAYSAGYDGALVRLTVKPGTSAQLQDIGIAANQPAAAAFPGMSTRTGPWNQTNARFKVEATGVMNINDGLGIMNTQLGKGSALDIFNKNLLDFERLN